MCGRVWCVRARAHTMRARHAWVPPPSPPPRMFVCVCVYVCVCVCGSLMRAHEEEMEGGGERASERV